MALTRDQKVRKRLLEDFEFYAKNCLRIRTKGKGIQPLLLNRAQLRFLDRILSQWQKTGRVRCVVLKGRQMGLSTLWEAFMYWWTTQHEGVRALVIAHDQESSTALFDMTKRYHDEIPDGHPVKMHTRYSSRQELVFHELNSSFTVAKAGGKGVGRGQTLQCLHASELAFWPRTSAKEILSGLLDAVPAGDDEKNTFVCLESTAYGMSGVFYEFWKEAGEDIDPLTGQGRNGYCQVFLPWFIQEEYREEPLAGFKRTIDEQELVDLYGLEDDQLQWRRRMVFKKGLELFQQEYPCTAMEAFLTSGRPVFELGKLNARLEALEDPIERLGFVPDGASGAFEADPRGELLVYRPYDPKEMYTIGADVAEGVRGRQQSNGDFEGDYSVAHVLDSKKRQVAVWRGHVDPDFFATTLNALGRMYDDAFLAVEVNGPGAHPCIMLERYLRYPRLYERTVYDKVTDEENHKVGFRTDEFTRPMILSELRQVVRENTIELNDRKTIEELITFVINPESGKMEADKGCHDDCVMSLAIANHVHEGVWEPTEALEELYIGTI